MSDYSTVALKIDKGGIAIKIAVKLMEYDTPKLRNLELM